ncbi:MAG: hypothetical protein Q8903_10085 [Bacteroidota bacterium]|nr:hypothetical protein [Bacteroidota bacterium]
MLKSSIIVIMIIISTQFLPLQAQSFGFGCLGLVGGFGGYSYQQYKADGLNAFIDDYNSTLPDSVEKMNKFSDANGYRVGINLFRGNLQGFILTVKGFYQSVSSKKSITQGQYSATDFELKLKTWGVGIDLGTVITPSFSWKVLDATLLYTSGVFTNTYSNPTGTTIVQYSSQSSVGYAIGSGFILSILQDYVTLEGTASYTIFSIHEMKDDAGEPLKIKNEPVKNFISNGGLNGVVQLNLSFPL